MIRGVGERLRRWVECFKKAFKGGEDDEDDEERTVDEDNTETENVPKNYVKEIEKPTGEERLWWHHEHVPKTTKRQVKAV